MITNTYQNIPETLYANRVKDWQKMENFLKKKKKIQLTKTDLLKNKNLSHNIIMKQKEPFKIFLKRKL